MGGGDDPHICLDRIDTANTEELPILKYTQQARLGRGGHVANFVEKQRAAAGLFKAPFTPAIGSGERAFFMAKQFRLHQFLRNCRHIERDECVVGTGAVAVQGPGNQLFTRPGFTIDQHRNVALGKPTSGAEHFLHGRRVADDLC